jgi:hypothetical protein
MSGNDETRELRLPLPRPDDAALRLHYARHDPQRFTAEEQRVYLEYYGQIIASEHAVVVIHPHRRSVYLRLVRWIALGVLGLLALWIFIALFGRITSNVTVATTPAGSVPPTAVAPVTLATVFPHPPTTAPPPTTAGASTLGGADASFGGLIVIMAFLAVVAAIGYWFYLRLLVSSQYITISQRQININNALFRRDPQTLPIERFSDGRYVQPYVSFLLSRGNRKVAWSWGNKFEIDTPGAQPNVRLDNVPQPRVVMALIEQLFRNRSQSSFQGLQRQVALAQAQYALAAEEGGTDPDPVLMEPWPPAPSMPGWARQPPPSPQ